MYGGDGALLTLTRDVVDLINPTDAPSDEETESGSSDVGPPISGAEVAEVVKKVVRAALCH